MKSERSFSCISALRAWGGSVELGEGTEVTLFRSVRKASRRWYRRASSVKGEATTDCCVARLATGEGVASISDRIAKSWDSNWTEGCIEGTHCVTAVGDVRSSGLGVGARPLVGDTVSSLVSGDITGEG